jgi:hypothetical protein
VWAGVTELLHLAKHHQVEPQLAGLLDRRGQDVMAPADAVLERWTEI